MDNWTKILVSSFTALVVLLVGQALIRFILDPIQDYRKLRAEVAHNLIFYKNVVRFNPARQPSESERQNIQSRSHEASEAFRRLAVKLPVQLAGIPAHQVWAFFGWIPSTDASLRAHKPLIALSNSQYAVWDDDVRERAQSEIIEALRFPADVLQ